MQTAEDLLRFREPGKTAELVRGVLIVREPPGTGHGARAARLTLRVGAFVERHNLGEVFAQDTGFKIERDPDTVRAPDVAFVVRERLAQIPPEGYAELAPDWVAEIVSPSDRPGECWRRWDSGWARACGLCGSSTRSGVTRASTAQMERSRPWSRAASWTVRTCCPAFAVRSVTFSESPAPGARTMQPTRPPAPAGIL